MLSIADALRQYMFVLTQMAIEFICLAILSINSAWIICTRLLFRPSAAQTPPTHPYNAPEPMYPNTPPPAYSFIPQHFAVSLPSIVLTLPDDTASNVVLGFEELELGSLDRLKSTEQLPVARSSELLAPRWRRKDRQQNAHLPTGYSIEVYTVGNRTRTRRIPLHAETIPSGAPRGKKGIVAGLKGIFKSVVRRAANKASK